MSRNRHAIHAKKIIDMTADFANTFSAEVRVLQVLETAFVGRAGPVNLESADGAQVMVNDAVDDFQARGLLVTGNVRPAQRGRLATEINDEAQDFGADLIVIGSRGLSDLEGLFVGSTSHRLLHVTNRPVVVIS